MLAPELDNAYYTDGDKTVQQMMDYYYQMAIQINQSFWSEADIDSRFLAGDQTLWNDIYGNLPAFRRRQFNFNRIRRIINMITGYQRQHRYSTTVIPVHPQDQDTADQLNKCLIWANNHCNAFDIISEAFEGALTTGMNLISVWMDYREDPISGNIKISNRSYNSYLIDPFFTKRDLSDCRFIWTREWMAKSDILPLLPDHESEIMSMTARGWRDGKFQFQPEAYNYAMQDLLSYDEFWYLDYRKRKMLVDSITGETLEWKGDEETLALYLHTYPEVTIVDQTIPTCKLAISVNGKPMYHGPNPTGIDRYPFAVMLGYYMPQIPYFPYRVQGVVRGLRDAQYLYNRRRVIELDILESQINSGIKYKEDALVNPKDAFLQGQGRGLALKATAQMDDVQQILPPQIPPSMIQLSELMAREIQEISGVNEELLGSAIDDKAGVLSMLRQGAGLTTLQTLFDQLNFTQKQLGHIFIDLIQENFTPGKVQKIINDRPSEQFYSRFFHTYDCEVEEGLYTSTQRQMQFAQLLQLKELGIPVPTELLIESSTLQDKTKLTQAIMQQEQAMQQTQMQAAQAELEVQKATVQSLLSRAQSDEGQGMERLSRMQENAALAEERRAQALREESMAVYQEVKAAKEIEGIDLDQIVRAIEVLQGLKGLLNTQQEQKENETPNAQAPQAPQAT